LEYNEEAKMQRSSYCGSRKVVEKFKVVKSLV